MTQWKEVRFFQYIFWVPSLLPFCDFATSLEGGCIAVFLYPMTSIAAFFFSPLAVTDRKGVDAERVYLLPPLFHLSLFLSRKSEVRYVAWSSAEGKIENRSTVEGRQGQGFSDFVGVCRKRTHDCTLLTVLTLRNLESLLSEFWASILLGKIKYFSIIEV